MTEECPICECTITDGICGCNYAIPRHPGERVLGLISKEDREALHAEIAQLKAELEMTKKERDQATRVLSIDNNGTIWSRMLPWGKHLTPELYAHLAGRGK